MKSTKLKHYIVLTIVIFSIFTICAYPQSINSEKTSSVAGFVLDKEEEAGLIRKRVAQTENVRIVPSARPSAEKIIELEKLAFSLINAKRAEIGLTALGWSDDVAKVARLHSENMAKFRFFSHRGIDGKMVNDRADQLGVSKWTAMGENIAYNRGFKDPIATAVEKWMESQSHRENLLNNRWKESAIGIAVSDDGTFYFTQVFMKK